MGYGKGWTRERDGERITFGLFETASPFGPPLEKVGDGRYLLPRTFWGMVQEKGQPDLKLDLEVVDGEILWTRMEIRPERGKRLESGRLPVDKSLDRLNLRHLVHRIAGLGVSEVLNDGLDVRRLGPDRWDEAIAGLARAERAAARRTIGGDRLAQVRQISNAAVEAARANGKTPRPTKAIMDELGVSRAHAIRLQREAGIVPPPGGWKKSAVLTVRPAEEEE